MTPNNDNITLDSKIEEIKKMKQQLPEGFSIERLKLSVAQFLEERSIKNENKLSNKNGHKII